MSHTFDSKPSTEKFDRKCVLVFFSFDVFVKIYIKLTLWLNKQVYLIENYAQNSLLKENRKGKFAKHAFGYNHVHF